MDESDFDTLATAELDHLADRLEAASEALEVDLDAEALTVELEDGRQYLISRHNIKREIWLSSPVSGAHHFVPGDGLWRSTRGPETLRALLQQELASLLGHDVELG